MESPSQEPKLKGEISFKKLWPQKLRSERRDEEIKPVSCWGIGSFIIIDI